MREIVASVSRIMLDALSIDSVIGHFGFVHCAEEVGENIDKRGLYNFTDLFHTLFEARPEHMLDFFAR